MDAYRKSILVLTAALAIVAPSHAQIHISTPITWETDQILTQSVIVDSGSTLTIQSGVHVRILYVDVNADQIGDVTIQINGRLITRGTPSGEVVFEPYESTANTSYWSGIVVNSSVPNDSIVGIIVTQAYRGLELRSASRVEESLVKNIRSVGILAYAGDIALTGMTVDSCGEAGISVCPGAACEVRNSAIQNARLSGIFSLDASVVLQNCMIAHNSRSGVVNSSGDLTVSHCDITGNQIFGILAGGTGSTQITWSSIDSNLIGCQVTEFKFLSDSSWTYEGAPGITVNNCNIMHNYSGGTFVDSIHYQNVLTGWPLMSVFGGTIIQAPVEIPYGWINPISYKFYAWYSAGDYSIYSIRDSAGNLLHQASSYGSNGWRQVTDAPVGQPNSDKYSLYCTFHYGGTQAQIGMTDIDARLSLKSYGVVNYVNSPVMADFRFNYWGQLFGIDTLLHCVNSPNIDYAGFQIAQIADAHSILPPLPPPTVVTLGTDSITSGGARIRASVNPNNASTTVWFEFGATTSYGQSVAALPSPMEGASPTIATGRLTGLLPSAVYHYRVVAVNATSNAAGADSVFRTLIAPPAVPVLVYPEDGASFAADSVRVVWNSAQPMIDRYWMETAPDSAFSVPTIDSTLTDTTAILRGLLRSQRYWWRVKAENSGGWGPFSEVRSFMVTLTSAGDADVVPMDFSVSQNYPNPFNPYTTIRYGLPHRVPVVLTVFNPLGQQVAQLVSGDMEAGYHEVRFDGSGLASGVYFYRIQAGSFTRTMKLLLVH